MKKLYLLLLGLFVCALFFNPSHLSAQSKTQDIVQKDIWERFQIKPGTDLFAHFKGVEGVVVYDLAFAGHKVIKESWVRGFMDENAFVLASRISPDGNKVMILTNRLDFTIEDAQEALDNHFSYMSEKPESSH